MLSKRLEAVASFVRDNTYCIDIGCDHALLDVYLANKYENIKLVASDVNEKPLLQAKKNIEKYQLQSRIEIKLGDGLAVLNDNVDTIIIAGIGGNNIVKILEDKEKLNNINQIIISPNNNEFLVKKLLCMFNYYIDNEVLILDHDIIYIVISFKKGYKKYSYKQLKYGTDNLKKNKILYDKYLNIYLNKYQRILEFLPRREFIKRYKIKKEIINIKSL